MSFRGRMLATHPRTFTATLTMGVGCNFLPQTGYQVVLALLEKLHSGDASLVSNRLDLLKAKGIPVEFLSYI